jgi:hypothetical protein
MIVTNIFPTYYTNHPLWVDGNSYVPSEVTPFNLWLNCGCYVASIYLVRVNSGVRTVHHRYPMTDGWTFLLNSLFGFNELLPGGELIKTRWYYGIDQCCRYYWGSNFEWWTSFHAVNHILELRFVLETELEEGKNFLHQVPCSKHAHFTSPL